MDPDKVACRRAAEEVQGRATGAGRAAMAESWLIPLRQLMQSMSRAARQASSDAQAEERQAQAEAVRAMVACREALARSDAAARLIQTTSPRASASGAAEGESAAEAGVDQDAARRREYAVTAYAAWSAAMAALAAAYRVRTEEGGPMVAEAAAAVAAASAAMFADFGEADGDAAPLPPAPLAQAEVSVLVRVCRAGAARSHDAGVQPCPAKENKDSDWSGGPGPREPAMVRAAMRADTTVGELKRRLEPMVGVPAADQRLALGGRLLADDEAVGAAGGAGFLGASGERVVLLWPAAPSRPSVVEASAASAASAAAAAAEAAAGADDGSGWTLVAGRRAPASGAARAAGSARGDGRRGGTGRCGDKRAPGERKGPGRR